MARVHVRAELQHRELAVAVDADGAVEAARGGGPVAVGVVGRALVVQGEHVLHVLDRDLALGLAAPRDAVALGAKVSARRGGLPGARVRAQEALHVPGARRVVDVIRVRVTAEGVARVEVPAAHAEREVEVIGVHPLAQVSRAEVLALLAKRVREVKVVDAQLVGHGHIAVVGHAPGDPVVAAHGLEPPDLVGVREGDAVHLVGAVALEQGAEALHAVAGARGIRQHERDHVLLADAAQALRLKVLLALLAVRGAILHERVRGEHALVGGEGLRGAHAHVALVEAGRLPEALAEVGVGHGGVAHAVLGQLDLKMREHAVVDVAGLGRLACHEALGLKLTARGVLVAGDDRGPVVAGLLANKDGGTGHGASFFDATSAVLLANIVARMRNNRRVSNA